MLTGRLRWTIPVAVTAGIGLVAALGATTANAGIDLPPLTAEQVLVLAQDSEVTAWSGAVRTSASLGLPELPDTGGSAAGGPAGLLSMLAGDREFRVWVDGPERQRVQLLGQFAQTDLVHDGRDLWTYDSAEDVYRHLALPAHDGRDGDDSDAGTEVPTPDVLARQALDAIDPTTRVSVGEDIEVAGRGAYELRLEPRTDDTLVGMVTLAVDAETGMALQVSVTARGAAEPAVLVGFTDLDLRTPPAERFRLSPPEGAVVEELTSPAGLARTGAQHDDDDDESGWEPVPDTTEPPGPAAPDDGAPAEVLGVGWTSIALVPAGASGDQPVFTAAGLLGELTTPVEGGRALKTALLSVLLADDGRVLAGAVPVEALVEAAN